MIPFGRVGAHSISGFDAFNSPTLQAGILTGGGKSHFEAALGVGVAHLFKDYGPFWFPAITLGYRKQKPGKHVFFRTGVSFPELVYFGWGYNFDVKKKG